MSVPKVVLDRSSLGVTSQQIMALRCAALQYVGSVCEHEAFEVEPSTGKIIGKSMALLEMHFTLFCEMCALSGYVLDCKLLARFDGHTAQLALVPNVF